MNRKNRALSQNKQVYLNRDDRVVLISLQKYAFSVLVGLCAHLSSFTPAYISHCLIFPFYDCRFAFFFLPLGIVSEVQSVGAALLIWAWCGISSGTKSKCWSIGIYICIFGSSIYESLLSIHHQKDSCIRYIPHLRLVLGLQSYRHPGLKN